jgi:RNA polymerase sigma-70 factor, ECF subfamily
MGTGKSFEEVALPYLPDVRRYAQRLTGDADESADLVQETYWRALRSWHTYRPDAPCGRWLFAICLNLFRRQWQRARRVVRLVDDDDVIEASWTTPDVAPAIDRAASQLSPILRSVFELVDVQGASYTEAADALRVPIGTVRSRLHRARACLRPSLMVHRHWAIGGDDTNCRTAAVHIG